MEEYNRATDDNMAHVHCMQDTKGYKHMSVCNTVFNLKVDC